MHGLYLVIWYGIGGVLRFAKIWYIGPPRRADSENMPNRVGFLFVTSYKLCISQVPFRHHYKNIYARKSIHHFESTITMRALTHKEEHTRCTRSRCTTISHVHYFTEVLVLLCLN